MRKPLSRFFGPLEHFDYSEIDMLCTCAICVEWRERLQALQLVQKQVQEKYPCSRRTCHIDMKGDCDDCKSGIRLRTLMLASMNRRDLYSECSFHAHTMDPQLGEAFMSWLSGVIGNRTMRPDGWWVAKAPFLPIGYWLVMFRRSVALGEDDLLDDMPELLPHGAVQALTASAASGSC